ncbi:extracellular solute-binding protein [Ferrimicrobium acidiphilum]|uniref:extracellular solute-binding protein n=1 Tax=Ferrimicrobium acidiphilum TaxID=121039 RepID=UPI0023F1C953|nr:extracellular solute-binding protein [Ferrimicrobium acidiphilum]
MTENNQTEIIGSRRVKPGGPITTRSKSLFVGATLLAAGGMLAACGSSTTSSSPASASAPLPTLVVYSAQGYDSATVTAFHKATGIPVSLDDDSTGPLLTKIQAEASNPKWGLLWVDGDEAFASMDRQGMLLKGWEPNVNFNSLGKALIPADKSYIPTGLTMAGTLVYNSSVVQNPPKTWSDLLSSNWKGQIGMNDPAVSGPTFPFVAGMMNYLGGITQGEAYYQELKANGLQVFQTNGDTLHALETGQIKLALIQSSAGIGAGIKVSGIKTVFLAPSTPIPGVIGIDNKMPTAVIAEAKKFVQFVLSPAGQKAMQSGDPTGDSLYWPVLSGINPLPAVPSISSIKTQVVNPYKWGPQEGTINTWFTNNIVG